MMSWKAWVFVGMIACAPVWPVWGADGVSDDKALQEVHEVVKQLQARYEKTKDLQADFTQKTRIEGFERPVTSSGKVYIKKPGRLRWDYLDPADATSLERGNRLEAPWLSGAVSRLGRAAGVPTPTIDAIYACASLLAKSLGEQNGKLAIAAR